MTICLLSFLFGVINVVDYFYVCMILYELCCLVIVEK